MKVLNGTERFGSFSEAYTALYGKKKNKKTKLKDSTKERFFKKHVCPVCGEPLTFIQGTNVMVCRNDLCKGFKQTQTDKDGNKKTVTVTPFHTLDKVGTSLAEKINDEKEN